MKIVMFYHSLMSDWNHGNAHFLRGVVTELLARGHDVHVYEPRGGWSRRNLTQQFGQQPIRQLKQVYPHLASVEYDDSLNLDRVLDRADLVLVHEWNDHSLVRRIGAHRDKHAGYRLLFHDTHHRSVTDAESMAAFDLSHYDGVLAFGDVVRDIYLARGWVDRAWTWHEAADTRIFHPIPRTECEGDLVWIGNWGDGERTEALQEFLFDPISALGLEARIHGVRYPKEARAALAEAGIDYAGWLPNYQVPQVFSRFRVTVHVPRRPYLEQLPGVPTIRPFEALACGIPLVSARWSDGSLFEPGRDYLVANSGAEMRARLQDVLHDEGLARELSRNGLRTIRAHHTCAHRVDELLHIASDLGVQTGTLPADVVSPLLRAPSMEHVAD